MLSGHKQKGAGRETTRSASVPRHRQGYEDLAGWVVTAIENDYELPEAYKEALAKEGRAKKGKDAESKCATCFFCGPRSWTLASGTL
jgi:hypothetical protein